MEVSAASRNGLLNTIDDIPGHVKTILDVNVHPRQAKKRPGEPEQHGTGCRVGTPDHDARTVEDARSNDAIDDEAYRGEEAKTEWLFWGIGDDCIRIGCFDQPSECLGVCVWLHLAEVFLSAVHVEMY